MNYRLSELPPITITKNDERRLSALANLNELRFPRVAHFLARELDRANVVPDEAPLPDVVRMGSRITYRDDKTGRTREITLVYPEEADIAVDRISVLAPIGVALIGLSVGQSMEFQTPIRETRSLTVLAVSN
jgi:regulator of nucleoside diphosphate kinase